MNTIAIDFGASNTVVSILEPNSEYPKSMRFSQVSRLYRLKNLQGKTWEVPVIPSLLFVRKNQELILGEKVRSLRLNVSKPHRCFKNFKRDLVANFQAPPRHIDGQIYDSQKVSELFIKEIWQFLKKQKVNSSEVIFTVPIGAYEKYLNWFHLLAKELKIKQVKFVDESTAAALGYALKKSSSIVLVIDFGGGTLDLSLVRTSISNFKESEKQSFKAEVLAKSDAYIGGQDIDMWIVENYLRQQKMSREDIGETGWQNLLNLAEKLKIRLSYEEKVQEIWLDEDSFMSYELELTRNDLEEILERQKLLEQLRYCLDQVLHLGLGKGTQKKDIEQVLLVGGSCSIPAIKKLIVSYFGKEKVKFHNPFNAVCHGALALSKFKEIDDYLHHSYALRLWDHNSKSYTYFSLFAKGLHYPCQREKPLLLQVASNGQTEIKLDVGELAQISQAEVTYDSFGRIANSYLDYKPVYRSLESNNQEVCLGYLNPPGEIGVDRISAFFEVDKNRFLLVTVKDLLTKKTLVDRQAIATLK